MINVTSESPAIAFASNVFPVPGGNQFLKKYVGEGAEKVHEVFNMARKYAPSILFIDEIDVVGKERRGIGLGNECGRINGVLNGNGRV